MYATDVTPDIDDLLSPEGRRQMKTIIEDYTREVVQSAQKHARSANPLTEPMNYIESLKEQLKRGFIDNIPGLGN